MQDCFIRIHIINGPNRVSEGGLAVGKDQKNFISWVLCTWTSFFLWETAVKLLIWKLDFIEENNMFLLIMFPIAGYYLHISGASFFMIKVNRCPVVCIGHTAALMKSNTLSPLYKRKSYSIPENSHICRIKFSTMTFWQFLLLMTPVERCYTMLRHLWRRSEFSWWAITLPTVESGIFNSNKAFKNILHYTGLRECLVLWQADKNVIKLSTWAY